MACNDKVLIKTSHIRLVISDSPFLRLMNSNFSGINVSRLTLMEFKPAFFNCNAFLRNVTPFVVRAIDCRPGNEEIFAIMRVNVWVEQ